MTPTFILCGAGRGIRNGSEKPNLLAQFNDNEYLFEKQVAAIRQVMPGANLIYITGFNCDKIDYRLEDIGCKVLHNLNYEETSAAYSLYLGLRQASHAAFVICGNMFFDDKLITFLHNIKHEQSYIVTSNKLEKYGVVLQPNHVFDYGKNPVWSKVAYLSPLSIYLYRKAIENSVNNNKKLIFEIFNQMIRMGDKFHSFETNCYLRKIQKIKDIKKVNGYLKNGH